MNGGLGEMELLLNRNMCIIHRYFKALEKELVESKTPGAEIRKKAFGVEEVYHV